MSPHQDWTIVDEKQFVAINIWTPLIDTNADNGTLFVVPKSQAQKMFALRAPTIPFYFLKYFDAVLRCGIPTNAVAGEAVILNQSLIHYSSANTSDKIRIAITSGIKSKGAPMLFHYRNAHNEINRYTMPEDFLLDFADFGKDIYETPANALDAEKIAYNHPAISKIDFLEKFGNKRLSFWDKIKEHFR